VIHGQSGNETDLLHERVALFFGLRYPSVHNPNHLEYEMLLVGDVGGTKTVLAVVDPAQDIRQYFKLKVVRSAEYASMEALLADYTRSIDYPSNFWHWVFPGLWSTAA